MINDYPNLHNQDPVSQKLVLPGQAEEQYQPDAHTQSIFIHPDQVHYHVAPTTTNPFSKLGALWRSDPAYKVLMVAAAMILVAGIIFATFLINAFAQSTPSTPKAAATVRKIASTAPKTPTNMPPTFPTPSGGQGSQQSTSQPPKSAPMVLPTLTSSDPNQQSQNQNQNQNLQLQITNYPQQVNNNSDVQIAVMANQSGISVHLQVSFDNSIITNTSDTQDTANDGTATLDWQVTNASFQQNFVARITAIGIDQNGQQVSSQTISVQVANNL